MSLCKGLARKARLLYRFPTTGNCGWVRCCPSSASLAYPARCSSSHCSRLPANRLARNPFTKSRDIFVAS